jgi:thiol-disulfide isomerase/thioredoxin
MTMRRLSVILAATLLVGCGDSDGDGLSNKDEEAWGSDPEVADTDGDGIPDGEEVFTYGNHPAFTDSDLDGIDDNVEIDAGFDPLDPDDRPYLGGWPTLSADAKNALEGDGAASGISMGALHPRFKFHDQYGDKVDFYDFAGQGKPIIIDVSAEWCGPCNLFSEYMTGEEVSGMEWAEPIRDAVNAGDAYLFTVLGESNSGAASKRTAKDWARSYPNDAIPVLADVDQDLVRWSQVPYWSFMYMVDENMEVIAIEDAEVIAEL